MNTIILQVLVKLTSGHCTKSRKRFRSIIRRQGTCVEGDQNFKHLLDAENNQAIYI